MLTEATKANLRRKAAFVDRVQMRDGVPMPSLIELNLTELCNRKCVFCPRVDGNVYPNQALHMSLDLARKIADDLRGIEYRGTVTLCGYGEPMLHPKLPELVALFGDIRVEIVTNGDFLDANRIRQLAEAGIDYFIVSMYDGPEQIEKFEAAFAEAECTNYLLRDRWHTEADEFGLKLTNRAGSVDIGPQEPVDQSRACFYPSYQMMIDWNGDVLLCPQDWSKLHRHGSLAFQTVMEVWTSKALHKRRMQLVAGRRCTAPCNGCNTDGQLHGFVHADIWNASGSRQVA
jgi:MoaA/NifB/PqqE/SkfB family radical SAM enzyme